MDAHDSEVADRVSVRVLYLHQSTLWPWWNYPRLCDGYWRFYWHDRAGAAIVWNRRAIPLPARRAVIIPAGVEFASSASPGVSQLYANLDVLGFPPPLSTEPSLVPKDAGITAMMEELAQEVPVNAPPSRSLTQITNVKAAFLRAMALLLRERPETDAGAICNFRKDGIERCLRLMAEDPGHAWTVADLAARCRLSPSRFHHNFLASVGQTPLRWLAKRRLAMAAQQLALGKIPIADIARTLGFHDRQHLTRLFSREYGTAPAEFRRKSQSEGSAASI